MNHCGIQQKSSFSPLVCPKPRRVSEPVRPFRWQMCYQQEQPYDSKAGAELLDLILAKGGGYGATSDQTCTQVASSPPYFCGSPPSRVSNPLIQDARFGDDNVSPISPKLIIPNPTSGASPSSSAWKGGCVVRPNYGNKPAVRIEGFDCLDRDNRRSNRSVSALA